MERIFRVIAIVLIISSFFLLIDRQFFMKQRVLRHRLWEYTGGERMIGEFIDTQNIIFKGDTIIWTNCVSKKDTLLFVCQYFNTMKLMHVRTGKITKYSMKGANWTNYIEF